MTPPPKKNVWGVRKQKLPLGNTCIATGKSFCASGGKKTSTAFLGKGWFPVGGVPTSMICNCTGEKEDWIASPSFLGKFLKHFHHSGLLSYTAAATAGANTFQYSVPFSNKGRTLWFKRVQAIAPLTLDWGHWTVPRDACYCKANVVCVFCWKSPCSRVHPMFSGSVLLKMSMAGNRNILQATFSLVSNLAGAAYQVQRQK